MEERVKITVSYAGIDKRIPLVVTPSLELSDEQVTYAERELHGVIRHVFKIPHESLFYLHEAESGRIMSRETFREPTQLSDFPRHWYLTVENYNGTGAVVDMEEKPNLNGPSDYSDLLPLVDNQFAAREEETEEEEVRSLADLSSSDTKYQTITISCNEQGQFGFTLRHFSIQPSNIPRFDTPTDPPSHSDSRSSTPSRDSLDTLKLSSTFVYNVVPGGVAESAGLGKGDVVQMVNGVSVIRSGWEETRELLQQCGDEIVLVVLPKENDDLQFLYPRYAYGNAGDYTTSDGQIFACDLLVAVGNTSSDTKPNAVTVVRHNHTSQNSEERRPHDETDSPSDVRTSHKVIPKLNAQLVSSPPSLNSPPVGLVPFHDRRGSAVSYDSNSLSCSNENMAGQQTTADEILISGSLSEIPFANSPLEKNRFVDTSWGAHRTECNDPHELNGTGEYSPTWQNLDGVQNGEIHPPLNAQPQNSEFEYAHRELNFISEDPEPDGMEWYRETDEGAFADFSLAQDNSRSEELQSSASDTNFLSMSNPRRKTGRTVSQSSLERQHLTLDRRSSGGHTLHTRVALTSSMSALDQPFPQSQGSQGSHGRNKSKSTELGKIRLKKRGKKSLEVLTRIGSDEHVRRYSGETERRLKRHRSDENAHRVVRLSAPEVGIPDPWVPKPLAPVATPTHGIMGESDSTSQLSGSLPPPQGQLSGQSEEQKMSGDSGSTTRSVTSDIGASNIPVRGRRSGKSYQSQRAQLHKSRSRVEAEGAVGERPRVRRKSSSGGDNSEVMEPRRLRRAKGRSLTSSPPAEEALQEAPPPLPSDQVLFKLGEVQHEVEESEEEESPKTHVPEKLVPTIEQPTLMEPQHSRKESNELVRRENRTVRERPMSATESSPHLRRHMANLSSASREHRQSLDVPYSRHKLTHSVEVPLLSESSRRIPLYHTHSAQTPFGEQIVRDISIDDAIRASQGLSPMRTFSVDSGVVVSAANISPPPQQMYGGEGWKRQLYAKQKGSSEEKLNTLTTSSRERGRSTEVLPSSPSPTNMAISGMCNGVLSKKQDRAGAGKRSHDRSWKTYYAVLISTKIVFYKDRRDAIMSKPCEESPIVVVPSLVAVAHNYTKRKFVFRVATPHGSEYLLQASDAESMQHWVVTLQALNKGRVAPTELAPKEVTEIKPPSSPIAARKLASPQPSKTKKRREEGGGGSGLLDKLKRTLTRRESDEPDFSSFVTFRQPLEECPVSPENKRVPLVVEYCIMEVDAHGLRVEGIYRKPGMAALIKNMSMEMDKGNYNFTDYGDIHTIGSLLKKFFKELPDSLIPAESHDIFIACVREQDEEQRLTHLKDLVAHLPTAHYHTLKYLVAHLNRVAEHSDENKMTLNNIALVFGPTLVRDPSPDLDDLSTMRAGYTVIELLCKHMDFIFDSELCAEEQEWIEKLDALQREEEEEEAMRGSPLANRREMESKIQKDEALAKASPLTVRRIKNDFSAVKTAGKKSSSSSESKRNSLIPIEGTIPLQPKQQNSEVGSQSLPQYNSDTLKSNGSNPGHQSPEGLPQLQASLGSGTPYHYPKSNMRQQHNGAEGSDSVSRTRHWVNHHTEMGWGKDGESEESRVHGSMWASRNRDPPKPQPREKKEKQRLATPRRRLVTSIPSPVEPAHEFLASYSSPLSPSHTSTFMSPERHGYPSSHSYQAAKHSTLPVSSSPTRRRVSYAQAIGDHLVLESDYSKEGTPTRDRYSHDSLERPYHQHRHTHHRDLQTSGHHSHHQYSTQRQRAGRQSSLDSYGTVSPPVGHSLPVYPRFKRTVSPRHHSFDESPPERGGRLVRPAQVESYL